MDFNVQKALQLQKDCEDAAAVLEMMGFFATGQSILRETAEFLGSIANHKRAVPWCELSLAGRNAILAAYHNGQPIEWVYNPEKGWGSRGANSLGQLSPAWTATCAYRIMEEYKR